MSQMRMWRIDDGERHTIVAEDAAGAFAEYARMLEAQGWEWPPEKPECSAVAPTVEVEIFLDNDMSTPGQPRGTVILSAAEWCQLFTAPQYVACSEY